MTISLTILQRLNIEGMLSRIEKLGADSFTEFEIYAKVKVKDREKYVVDLPLGGTKLLDKAIETAVPSDFDFSKAEAQTLLAIVEREKVRATDGEWWVPLRSGLKSITESH